MTTPLCQRRRKSDYAQATFALPCYYLYDSTLHGLRRVLEFTYYESCTSGMGLGDYKMYDRDYTYLLHSLQCGEGDLRCRLRVS